jgi:MFS family permease
MHSAAVLAPAQARRNTGAWLAVALLAAAYAMNFVDRQIVNLLVEPLKHDLQISDSQIGLLQGVSFGIFYTLMGLPFGWLSDRTHRVRLICAGMLIWSVMTAACGLTSSFHALFLARMGVGCGEAALVPAAISLLADLFDPHQRALPMSIFTGGVSVGSGLALALGGATIAYAAGGAHDLPLIGAWLGQHRPWQTTFILVGLAGVPVALLLLLIREPQRRVAAAQSGPAQLDGLLMHLRRHRDVFLPMLLAVGCLYILTNAATAWIPSIFVREFGWHASAVGAALGLPVMISAMLGTLISGSVATWQARKGVPGAVLRTMVHGALFGLVPATVLAPLMPVDIVALAGVVLIFGTMTYTFAVATAVFVAITPNRLRGQMIALYLLVGNLFGLGLGPFSVGFCLDHVFQSPHPVGLALALVAFAAGLPGALLLRSSLPAYIALRAELNE